MGPLGLWDLERSDLYLKSCFEIGCAMVVQLIVQLDCAIPGGIVQSIVRIVRDRPQKCHEINFPAPIFQPGPQKCDEISFSDGFPTRTPEV